MSLLVHSPDHMFWSDASDQGWSAAVADQVASGLWSEGEELPSINHRELLAVERGLFKLRGILRGHVVAVISDTGGISQAPGRHAVSHNQRGGAADPPLDGAGGDLPPSTICPRQGQCGGQFSLSSQSGGGDGVDSSSGGLRLAPQTLACYDRSFCVISQSPLWCSFRASLGSFGCGDRCHTSVLGQSTGLCFSSIRHASSSSSEVTELQRGGHNLDSSILASEIVVPGLPELLLEPPLLLPERWDLLKQLHARLFHQRLGVLRLHAWRLSGDLREPLASLAEWLADLANPGDLRR